MSINYLKIRKHIQVKYKYVLKF